MRTVYVAFILISFLTNPLFSQQDYLKWQPETGVPVRVGSRIEWNGSSAGRIEGDLIGEVAFVWTDTRRGDPDVYMQVFDTDGNLKWNEGGVLVAGAVGVQYDPVVYPSREDGEWFVAWLDNTNDRFGDLYCTKINSDGEIIEDWQDENGAGISVCVDGDGQTNINILEDSEGGCTIAWNEGREVERTAPLRTMHISSEGQINEDWSEDGLLITEQNNTDDYVACPDSSGGMILVWVEGDGNDPRTVRAQRVTAEGDLEWGGEDGIPVYDQEGSTQLFPGICSDGEGGVFVSSHIWNRGYDIRLQRIDIEGNLLWGESGAHSGYAGAYSRERLVATGQGEAIAILQEYMEHDGDEVDILAMKISGRDSLIRNWEDNEGLVVMIDSVARELTIKLSSDLADGAYTAWLTHEGEDGRNERLIIQHLDSDGDLPWGNEGILLKDSLNDRGGVSINALDEDNCLVAWGDEEYEGDGIFAQMINSDGEAVFEDDLKITVDGLRGSAGTPQILSMGDKEFVVIWSDTRMGIVPYIQYYKQSQNENRVEPQLVEGGEPVFFGIEGLSIITDAKTIESENGWEIFVVGNYDINAPNLRAYAQRISFDDNGIIRHWGDIGLEITAGDSLNEQQFPKICEDGEEGVLIAWRDDSGRKLYMQRLNADGERMWGDEGWQISSELYLALIEKMISDGDGGAVIIYHARNLERNRDYDIWAARIAAGENEGEHLWNPEGEGLLICDADLYQRDVDIASHPEGYVLVWKDGRDNIFGQFITHEGEMIWHENGVALCTAARTQGNPEVAVNPEGLVWVVWEDERWYRTPRGTDIYFNVFDPSGSNEEYLRNFTGERDGLPLCHAEEDQVNPQIISDNNGGMWVFWEDSRENSSDIYATHLQPNFEPYEEWGESGRVICVARNGQGNPQGTLLSSDGEDGIVVTWSDSRASFQESASDIYMQRVDDDVEWADGVDDDNITPPVEFGITSVYPNPFNSTLNITYTLDKPGSIKLALYDIQGRIALEQSQTKLNAGTHRITLNAQNLPSGVYVVNLTVAEKHIFQKVALIR